MVVNVAMQDEVWIKDAVLDTQVMGKDNVAGLLRRLKPKVFLPLVNAEFDSEGPLSSLITEKGSVAELPAALKAEGLADIGIVAPEPGKPTSVDC